MDILLDLKRTREFLVCIDSDGCILDNMELKHKECFCPATVNVWNLQTVSRYARETAEFVNLYSRTRGTNRFPAIVRTLELLYARDEVKAAGLTQPDLSALRRWIAQTPVLGAAALEDYYRSHGDVEPVLAQAARWSREVDANIEHIVRGVAPFPYVKEAIRKLKTFADVVVISATPHEALVRELHACGVDALVTAIAGQELGTKSECIRKAMGDRYAPSHVLKIGDAPSDYKAAQDNGVLFYPILPGAETQSWQQLLRTDAERFADGSYAGAPMDARIADFFKRLPEQPPWIA
ncbi:MAG: HAD hydrolase-like protein [Oscillospiraceae bacterium]|nr:HAD hydrolase-like protein [Oscillospiraceae bacterium]